MRTTLKQAVATLDTLNDKVREIVEDNSIIFTHNEYDKCDNIYAYVIDWDLDEIIEKKVLALRIGIDKSLELLLGNKNIDYNAPLNLSLYNNEDWYACGTNGDSILFAPTILSIAESLDQYV